MESLECTVVPGGMDISFISDELEKGDGADKNSVLFFKKNENYSRKN